MLPASLRKAAILISTLDERAADALLEQMVPEQASKVRSALMELDEIEPGEQERILAEFLGRGPAASLPAAGTDSDEVALELSPESEAQAAASPIADREGDRLAGQMLDASMAAPFCFVQGIEPLVLARELAREQPQTVAAVLVHLAPARAAAVLESLPTTLATEALERMATIDQLAPEVLADLECELRSRLAPHLVAAAASVSSLQRLTSVLEAMDHRQRQRVALQLADRNTALANRLGLQPAQGMAAGSAPSAAILQYRLEGQQQARLPVAGPAFEFSELAALESHALRTVLAATDPAVVVLALTGAEPKLADRVLRRLPVRDAAILRRRLDQPGPLRLREIDAAQRELAAIASQLIDDGRITPPGRARFAAAA